MLKKGTVEGILKHQQMAKALKNSGASPKRMQEEIIILHIIKKVAQKYRLTPEVLYIPSEIEQMKMRVCLQSKFRGN